MPECFLDMHGRRTKYKQRKRSLPVPTTDILLHAPCTLNSSDRQVLVLRLLQLCPTSSLLISLHSHIASHRLAVDKLENVVVDKVLARRVPCQLEGLGVVHGAFLVVNLEE